MKAKENYYLNDVGEVVGEDSPDQATLLVGAGCEVSPDLQKTYDFADGQPNGLKSKTPKENKSKTPKENK